MVVIFNKQVIDKLDEYALALTTYSISTKRIVEKVEKLKNTLLSLGTSISTPPLCIHKDLGQILDNDGKPLNINLRRLDYKDKSGFSWAFACYYNYEADEITIIKMMASSQVKEDIQKKTKPILEFWNRLEQIR